MGFLLAHSAWQIDPFPTCWPMNGLFVHWSRGWGVLSFSERLAVWVYTTSFVKFITNVSISSICIFPADLRPGKLGFVTLNPIPWQVIASSNLAITRFVITYPWVPYSFSYLHIWQRNCRTVYNILNQLSEWNRCYDRDFARFQLDMSFLGTGNIAIKLNIAQNRHWRIWLIACMYNCTECQSCPRIDINYTSFRYFRVRSTSIPGPWLSIYC